MNLLEYKQFAVETAKKAGEELLKFYGKLSSVESKSTQIDLVTIADTSSEKLILEQIHSVYPNHDIITEESHIDQKHSDFRWVIDPLDGTTNYVHTLPIFAVSIGLQYKEETIVGVVYNPVYEKCFSATKGSGAFLNDDIITVSSVDQFSDSLLVTGFPYKHDKFWHDSFELFHDLYGRCQGIRRLGAAALDFCYVAMGRFDGFYEFGLKPWDICAGSLIVSEANGLVSDWNGSKALDSGTRILACSNIEIHKNMVNILSKNKYKLFF